jgi:cyanate permease
MRAWVVEAILFLIYFAFGISWFAFSPLRGDIEAFYHISKLEGGALFSSVSLAKSFVPVLAGFLVVRFGLKKSVLIGSLFCATSILVPFSPDYYTMLFLRFWFGVGGALVVTLMGPIVMQLFPRERLPLINGLNNVAVNAGIVTAFQVVPGLSETYSWRAILVGAGLFSLLLAVLWLFLGSDATPTGKPQAASFGEVARRKETWLIAMAFTGPLALYLALNSSLPDHFRVAFSLDPKQASQLTSLFNLVGIPTAIFSGWITGKLGLRRPLIIGAGLMMPLCSLCLCFAPIQELRLAAAIGLGISFFLYVAPLFTIPMELPGSSPAFVARLNGIVFSGAYLISGLSPMVVGYFYDKTQSYGAGLAFFCLTSLLLALGGWALPETGPQGRSDKSKTR